MRHSFWPRRAGGQFVFERARRGHFVEAPAGERDHVVAASETVALVLSEDSPLPENAADVRDLACLLRGHVGQLGAQAAPGNPALVCAQQLCSDNIPEGDVPSRMFLIGLAKATQELTACVQRGDLMGRAGGRRWRRPSVNVLRGSVFVLALACLVFAASVPQR